MPKQEGEFECDEDGNDSGGETVTQADLFTTEFSPAASSEPSSRTVAAPEQKAELKRVKQRLGTEILFWAKKRLSDGDRQFHLTDLLAYLAGRGIEGSPASGDRILRHLRSCKALGYRVLNRRQSLYELTFCVIGRQ